MFKAPNPGGLIGNPASPYCQISFQQEGLFAHMTTGLWFVFKVVDLMINAFCCFLLRKKKKKKTLIDSYFWHNKASLTPRRFSCRPQRGRGGNRHQKETHKNNICFSCPIKIN